MNPWSSPVILVPSHSFCIDFRKLNAFTKRNAYPLPRFRRYWIVYGVIVIQVQSILIVGIGRFLLRKILTKRPLSLYPQGFDFVTIHWKG